MIDDKIIQGCLENQRSAQRKLYELCYPILARVGYRYAKNEDEIQEIINEGFINIIKDVEKIKGLTLSFEAYVWRCGVNKAIDLFRKYKNYKNLIRPEASFSEEWKMQEGVEEGNYYKQMDVKEIMECMRSLPDLSRQVMNLFAIDGYAHAEIAKMLHISEELSRWHLYKARKLMKEKLKKAEII